MARACPSLVGVAVSADWAQYNVGDWLHLTGNERCEYRLNGDPIDRESVRNLLGFCPDFTPLDPEREPLRVVSVKDGIVTVEW